jgi:hypothetical protein
MLDEGHAEPAERERPLRLVPRPLVDEEAVLLAEFPVPDVTRGATEAVERRVPRRLC